MNVPKVKSVERIHVLGDFSKKAQKAIKHFQDVVVNNQQQYDVSLYRGIAQGTEWAQMELLQAGTDKVLQGQILTNPRVAGQYRKAFNEMVEREQMPKVM